MNNALHFQHQDWTSTQRLTTSYNGATEGTYSSLPFGDGFFTSGTDLDPYHFAELDHDYESGLDHAQYREYSSAQGRWNSPDPYDGSYDPSNPQSFNRYSYVGNNPLSLIDPTGQIQNVPCSDNCGGGGDGGAIVGVIVAGVTLGIDELINFLEGPSFHGSLKPRPNAQPWDEHNIYFSHGSIAGALGLPDESCEFGACGGGPSSFGPGGSIGAAGTVNIGWVQPLLTFDLWFLKQTTPVHGAWTYGNWCGAGGAGTPVDGHDSHCMMHDYCYFMHGFSATSNFSLLPLDQRAQLQACNQQLCNGEKQLGGWTADQINGYFYSIPSNGNGCR